MRLVCAFRLGALCASRQAAAGPLESAESIYQLFAAELLQLDREVLSVALLDTRFRLLKKTQISVGTLNESIAHPREILKAAIRLTGSKRAKIYGSVLYAVLTPGISGSNE